MNDISWMLYAAEVFGGAKAAFGLGAVALAFLGGVLAIWAGDMQGRYETPERQKAGKALRARVVSLWWVPPALIFACVVTPSSGTIYAIAASEVGETVINSETSGKALKALDAWLETQIKGGARDKDAPA